MEKTAAWKALPRCHVGPMGVVVFVSALPDKSLDLTVSVVLRSVCMRPLFFCMTAFPRTVAKRCTGIVVSVVVWLHHSETWGGASVHR